MPQFLQTISDSIIDGGFLMIPYCLLTVAWMISASAEVIQRPLFADTAAHLLFPLGFIILALLSIAQKLYDYFELVSITGDPSHSLALDGQVFARALVVIVVTAALSLFTSTLIWLVRAKGSSFGIFQKRGSDFPKVDSKSPRGR